MEKNTATYIYKLQPGDRFYKVKDKGRKIYEMVEAEPKVTAYRTYSYWAIADGSDVLTAFKGNTEVMYLRHNEAVPVKPKPFTRRLKPSLEHYSLMHKIR